MQLPPYVLGGAAVAAGICAYWLLKGPSGPRQGAGKTAGNAQARPTRRTSITPSLGRRRATIASPRTLGRQDTSVLMRSAATARLEAARANCFAGQRYADLEKECARLATAKQTWHDDAFPRTDESMFVTGIPPAGWAIRDGERGKALLTRAVIGPAMGRERQKHIAGKKSGEAAQVFLEIGAEICAEFGADFGAEIGRN